jgi:hypothetical protein
MEELGQLKNSITSSGIEPVTFRLLAQCRIKRLWKYINARIVCVTWKYTRVDVYVVSECFILMQLFPAPEEPHLLQNYHNLQWYTEGQILDNWLLICTGHPPQFWKAIFTLAKDRRVFLVFTEFISVLHTLLRDHLINVTVSLQVHIKICSKCISRLHTCCLQRTYIITEIHNLGCARKGRVPA